VFLLKNKLIAYLKLVSYKTPTPVVLAYSSNLALKSVKTSVSLYATNTDLRANLALTSVELNKALA